MTPGILAPAMLLLLALGALIIWLHSTQPVRRIVPSMQIWLSLPDMAGVSKRRRRLPKPSALLFLQLAAFAALVLALAQPFLGARPADHLVVVLDGSAEMNVSTDGVRTFDKARADLESSLRARNGAAPQRVSIILSGPAPQLLAARHPYEPEMAAPLVAATLPSDGPANTAQVLDLIRQTLLPNETVEGLYIGAHLPQALRSDEALPSFEHTPITLPALAPRLDLRLSPTPDGKWRIQGGATAAATVEEARLEIGFTSLVDIGEHQPLPWTSFRLKFVDGVSSIDETITLKDLGLITVSVSAEDTQPWAGSTHYTLTTSSVPQRVLYVAEPTSADQPLIRALLAQDNVEVFKTSELPSGLSEFALVVVDNLTLPNAPAAHTIWLGSAGVAEISDATAAAHDADYWHPVHPLTRGLDWHIPDYAQVSTRSLPAGAEVLVAGNTLPLLATIERETYRDLFVRFDPRTVDWKGSDVLPLLSGQITDWLGLAGMPLLNCQVGLTCGAQLGSYTSVTGAEPFSVSAAAFIPSNAGVFTSETGQFIAINAAPSRAPAVSAENVDPNSGSAPLALMPWLILLALALMAADAALRYRKSGRRSLTALIPMALLGAAVIGVALPLPFVRSVAVTIAPQGAASVPGTTTIAAGPVPRLASSDTSAQPATRVTHLGPALALAEALVPPHQHAAITISAPIRTEMSASNSSALSGRTAITHTDASVPETQQPELVAIAVPADAKPGDRIVLTALVSTPVELPAEVSFHANGTQLAAENIALLPGMNRIETELPPLALGETLFTVNVSTERGFASKMSAITTARAGRPILVLAPALSHGEAFAEMALPGHTEADVAVLDPASAPDYLRGWLNYDAVVLVNMPARAITSREAGLVETAVSEHGLGLIALGGNKAFGPGGYYATPFENLSPLSARVPREAPEVTMVFVLDRSGSMNQTVGSGTRLELARQATAGAIELLNPASQVGIVVFDTEARVILPLTAASESDAIRAALAEVDTGGGTAIVPGLEAGWGLLQNSEAQARHMIVMSDGLSLPGDFAGIAGQMRDQGITVSAVAVGTEADTRAVIEIAQAGGGSVHASDDFASLPSILSQEAMLLSSPVREGVEQPRVKQLSADLMRGLSATPPSISGLVLTTEKPEALVSMTSTNAEGEEAPLMASWRYGNGSVLAFASDATGEWTRNWRNDATIGPFWAHVLRQIRPIVPASGPFLAIRGQGETIALTLDVLDDEGAPRFGLAPIAEVTFADGAVQHIALQETAPGTYTANILTEKTGRIHARVAIAPPKRLGAAARDASDLIAESATFINRAYWAEPISDVAPRFVGGIEKAPEGMALRLVPGLTTPWTALALLAFLITLFFYMRPPRPRAKAGMQAPTNQGLAS
ncbi:MULTISPECIES: VWA domain-containing protein [unclassified Devosia]|uniref:VWA domain-containing protein n=1 Tax=unclassified Devosia TaxID=196773 RepID=UPI00145D8B58|nr:VWA domain-containing protein [Devosia sp. MC521]MBJ6987909.1 VWA domain-containing protein [Devosia sp. MC521]QMW63809.1 VWA domain-containing protein [Devosia sp. MC521]